MKLKLFQKQDLARAALHDGLILSWDTGLGKTWALYLWALLKVGYTANVAPGGGKTIRPKKPVLIIAPGDLHQQICEEGMTRFGVRTITLDSQASFTLLCCNPGSATPNLSADGRPIVPPDFYITSYSQLTTNGVQPMPDAFSVDDPFALQRWLCLPTGEHVDAFLELPADHTGRPPTLEAMEFESVCHFFAARGIVWKNAYHLLSLHPDDSLADFEQAYDREVEATEAIYDIKTRGQALAELNDAKAILENLFTVRPCPKFAQLATDQQTFVVRHFCAERIEKYSANLNLIKSYPIGPEPQGFVPDQPDTDTRSMWQIKCLYQPSLADLSYNAFEAISIDEGVKMKGEETFVGKGVRSMQPKYRLVLTATPVKNRVPDIFRLAWWATGGKTEAHARFPYRDDSEERAKFASTFMVTESNLTKAANARASNGGRRSTGGEGSSRFTKLTAEVCNVHRLWKLLGPIVLRRRKDDCGEDMVPKIRRVIRCEMGTHQHAVYKYHLEATYLDVNLKPATGAKLQALRMAAADPSSEHLKSQGVVTGECPCRFSIAEVVEGRNDQGEFVEYRHRAQDKGQPHSFLAQQTPDESGTVWTVFSVNGSVQTDTTVPDKETAVRRTKVLSDRHRQPADKSCRRCAGSGTIALPERSGQSYIPKFASTMTLIHEILERREQCVVFSAFTDPLDKLSGWLSEANVRHVKLDGRTSQKKRGALAAVFKQGRATSDLSAPDAVPVMLAGVECMAEGHSFHLANNVILIAYSWAYDKFIQAINRVHRMTSAKPVNVYVVLCSGTIDARLESLIGDKGDAAELVLDGRLIGERSEEVNLAELLKIAHKEFDGRSNTIDESLLHAEWPQLRAKLSAAQIAWDHDLTLQPSTKKETMRRNVNIRIAKPIAPGHELQAPAPVEPPKDWRQRLAERAARLNQSQKADVWDAL